MNAGKIIEQGTHDELMKKNGFILICIFSVFSKLIYYKQNIKRAVLDSSFIYYFVAFLVNN